jgi:hypothetical protein
LPDWSALIVIAVSLLVLAATVMIPRWGKRAALARIPPWARSATACLNAYIKRDYRACVSAGMTVFEEHQIVPVGLTTIVALRRLGRNDEADELGGMLLMRSLGPGGVFLHLMRVLDGDLDPDALLARAGGPDFPQNTEEFQCQVYFRWGARLLTERKSMIK